MYVSALDGRKLLAVNRSMLQCYGYTAREFLRLRNSDFRLEQPSGAMVNALASAAHSGAIEGVRRTHRKKDGTPINAEVWTGDFISAGKRARLNLIYDTTGRLHAERELVRIDRAQRMLSACNDAMIRADQESFLLQRICDIAIGIGGYKAAFVAYAEYDADKSVTVVADAGQPLEYLKNVPLSWNPDKPRGDGSIGRAIRSKKPIVVDDIAIHQGTVGHAEPLLALGLRSTVSLPLRNNECAFGALSLLSAEPRSIGHEELALLEQLADNLAFGINTLRGQETQRRAHAERDRMHTAVLKLAAGLSASGSEFFVQLSANMVDALSAQAAFVARLLPGPGATARTVGAVVRHQVQPVFDVSLADWACENMSENDEWCVTEGVGRCIPVTPLSAAINADAFVARRLDNSAGKPIGLIVVAFSERLEHVEFVASTVRIFAARAAAEMERQEADARIRDQASLLDRAQDAISVRDMDGVLLYWNRSAERLYGWTSAEVVGSNAPALTSCDPGQFSITKAALLATDEWHGELTQACKDGTLVIVESRCTLVRDDAGLPKAVLVIDTDISARREADLKIQKLAFYDPLTDLPNRLLLYDRLEQALAAAVRDARGGAILLIDLDNFKAINDTWGYDKGDLLLREVAARLQGCVRETDTVARLGGDEFVVLLTSLPPYAEDIAAQARTVGEEILASIGIPYLFDGSEYHTHASIGIARFSDQSESANDLLKQAEIAMYTAKSSGRQTLQFFDTGLQAAVTARAELEADLRQAFVRKEFLLHYQPQINSNGQAIGVEALIRWQSPRCGLVSPAEFIPVCEETGMILTLGQQVLEMACQVLAAWRKNPLLSGLTMAVNVSPRQFKHPDFVKQVRAVLLNNGAHPRQLKLELTESIFVDDMDSVIEKMTMLRSMGVSFSLDDFGTGYSCLSYLKRLPLNQLKIDQSFVRDVLNNVHDAAIVQSVIALGHSFGLEVIAEGVEELAQSEFLAKHGCHTYQGYFFSRPLVLDALENFLERTNAPDAPHKRRANSQPD